MASKDLVDIPPEYICLLTKEMMENPTLASDGKNYEKDAIEKYINEHKKSPATGEPLEINGLKENQDLKKKIVEFKEEIPKIIAAKFREKMLGDLFGFKQEEEKLDTVQTMMENLNIKEPKGNPEIDINDFQNKNLLKFANKEVVLPAIPKISPEELAKKVNIVFEEDIISPTTIAEILEAGAEVAREKYVVLTLENRKSKLWLFPPIILFG